MKFSRFINYALLYLAIPSWVLNHTEWVITSWILVVNPALCVHIKVCTCLSIRWNQLWKSDYGFSNWLITIAVWKWCYLLKVIRSRNKNCRAVTSPKKEKNIFFLSWWLGNTWNLKSKFKFQVFPSRQDRKTHLFICLWEKFQLNNFVSRSTDL